MSLIVSQTLPYTLAELQLSESTRWSQLFPLIRPSVQIVETPSGLPMIVDTALKNSKDVLIVAVCRVGQFSAKLLSLSLVAAFGTEPPRLSETKARYVSEYDAANLLKDCGFPVKNGVVLLRNDVKKGLRTLEGVLEVRVDGEMAFDHALSLLGALNAETRASLEKTREVLSCFVNLSLKTTSKFLEEKVGDAPSVNHAAEIAEFNSAKKAVDRDLGRLLSSIPTQEAGVVLSVHYSDINGLSRLENNILAHEISEYLAKKKLPSYVTHSTIQSPYSIARGWAISILPLSGSYLTPQPAPTNNLTTTSSIPNITHHYRTSRLKFSDKEIRALITAGCASVMASEPKITEYDTIVGDGDCGYTLRDGAKQVISFLALPTTDLSAFPQTLGALVEDLEVNMGGTSGALYCIFLSSLAQELWSAERFSEALKGALEHLLKYTSARLGDRTCLDCLIPFVETLGKTGNARMALVEAERGVEGTKQLEAKVGRSSYLDEAATRGVPDPGAYGLLKLLEGMVGAT